MVCGASEMAERPTELWILKNNETQVLPSYARPGDAGLDLASCEDVSLAPLTRATISTGLTIEIPPGMCGLVLPRSGLASKFGITLLNAPGLIDSGYRGEVKVVVYNSDSKTSFDISVGDRVAQLLVIPFPAIMPLWRDALSNSERGSGGFGHSGVSGR